MVGANASIIEKKSSKEFASQFYHYSLSRTDADLIKSQVMLPRVDCTTVPTRSDSVNIHQRFHQYSSPKYISKQL
jgi:hypothetical protein